MGRTRWGCRAKVLLLCWPMMAGEDPAEGRQQVKMHFAGGPSPYGNHGTHIPTPCLCLPLPPLQSGLPVGGIKIGLEAGQAGSGCSVSAICEEAEKMKNSYLPKVG